MTSIKLFYPVVLLIICFSVFSCENDEPGDTENISYETINGFVINEKGEKLLATDKGILLYNLEKEKFEFVKNDVELIPVNDLAFSKYAGIEELWLASNNGVFNLNTGKNFTTSNSNLKNNAVTQLDFDFENRGIFANQKGLSILSNNKWFWSTGQNDIYKNFEISDIASAVNGFTYITTIGGGVERIKMDVDGISGATVFDTDWSKLESNNINTVFIDSATQVYGTDAGVAMHFSEHTKWDWETYSTADGLINDTVTAVLKDKSGIWWFGTKNGLSSFDNKNWTDYSVETHKIISNNIKFLALDIDGSIWIATDEGLSHFTGEKWLNYSN